MNCIVVDDEEFSRDVIKHFVNKTDTLKLIAECESAGDAFTVLKKNDIDIVFLDVEMPEMSGLDLVKALDDMPQIILVTSRPTYAVEAFEYSITDFLVKPVNYARFLKAVSKAENNLKASSVTVENKTDEVFVKTDSKMVKLKFSEIIFIEALSDYVIINTPKRKYIIHSTMKGLEKKLPEKEFSRVHRSYIVNMLKIESIELSCTCPWKSTPDWGFLQK